MVRAMQPGSVLVGAADRYRILERVGSGGFGTVWRAERHDGRPVAIKSTHRVEDARRFEAEAATLRRLMHDNLPRYYEAWIDASGNGYLVMEYVPGEDMKTILERQGALTVDDAKRVALQVCNALNLLHQQVPPIYHRDIKPANIRRTPEGLIKLVDFGLMKAGDDRTVSDLRGAATLVYAPIEQTDVTRGTDARSDIYSLAATLYTLVHARLPLMAVARQGRTPDPLVPPNTGDARLDVALARGMAVEPADRPASVMAFRRLIDDGHGDVSTVISPRPAHSAPPARSPSADPPTPPVRSDRHTQLPWTGVLVGAALVSVLVAGFVAGRVGLQSFVASMQPTVTSMQPTVTSMQPTATSAPPTATSAPPTATSAPPTATNAAAGVFVDRVGAAYVTVPAGGGLAAFRMMQTEVTNAQYRACVDAGACTAPMVTERALAYYRENGVSEKYWVSHYGDPAYAEHPVAWVTREQAREYAAWVGGALPTEAQWLRACRGDDGRTYPWGEAAPGVALANFYDPSRDSVKDDGDVGDTVAVGSYPAGASPYGALDMAGNVWEWAEPNDGDDGRYIVRGGAFLNIALNVGCSARNEHDIIYDNYDVSFRVVSPGR